MTGRVPGAMTGGVAQSSPCQMVLGQGSATQIAISSAAASGAIVGGMGSTAAVMSVLTI